MNEIKTTIPLSWQHFAMENNNEYLGRTLKEDTVSLNSLVLHSEGTIGVTNFYKHIYLNMYAVYIIGKKG